MKFESGTGWPSFFEQLPGVFETRKDSKLFRSRIEYHCVVCDGHHGHVFDDGPPPAGKRYYNNGAALVSSRFRMAKFLNNIKELIDTKKALICK
jgi:peptide-methionine (R)-S-oxide reductase